MVVIAFDPWAEFPLLPIIAALLPPWLRTGAEPVVIAFGGLCMWRWRFFADAGAIDSPVTSNAAVAMEMAFFIFAILGWDAPTRERDSCRVVPAARPKAEAA